MPDYIKYRGAGRVPIVGKRIMAGEKNKKDPKMKVKPRADYHHAGEPTWVTRRKSNIYHTSSPIPKRKKK